MSTMYKCLCACVCAHVCCACVCECVVYACVLHCACVVLHDPVLATDTIQLSICSYTHVQIFEGCSFVVFMANSSFAKFSSSNLKLH